MIDDGMVRAQNIPRQQIYSHLITNQLKITLDVSIPELKTLLFNLRLALSSVRLKN